jgi:tetratricopeptide (TPR) repeat protein
LIRHRLPPGPGYGYRPDPPEHLEREVEGHLKRTPPLKPRTAKRLVAVLAGLALAVVVSGTVIRDRPATSLVAPIPEIVRATTTGRDVVFVGLDGADWDLLDRYAASGVMPNLKTLVEQGTGGVLLSAPPMLSPLVWTTMMTGVSPTEHRILDFTRRRPGDGREEPITSDERRVPAVWNMATWGGKRVAVLGLWATHPAEPVNGLVVSDRVLPFLFTEVRSAPGLVFPPTRMADVLEARRRAQEDVGLNDVRAYIPDARAAEIEKSEDLESPWGHPVSALHRILVETRFVHTVATDVLRGESPNLTIAYFEGTDSIGHVFAPFAPPRRPGVTEADYRRYHRVPEAYFRHIDTLLGVYRRLAEGSGAVLMLASDHGFRWAEARPVRESGPAHAQAAEWHRLEGMYLLWGNGIVPEPGHPHRGRVDQVAATLLALLGLPPGPAGPPLSGVAPRGGTRVDYAAHYQPRTPARPATTEVDDEALGKLRALGYVDEQAPDAGPAGSTRTAGSHANECLILRLEGHTARAAAAAQMALSLDPGHPQALWCLGDVLWADPGERDRSDELLVRAYERRVPNGIRYIGARAGHYLGWGEADRGARLVAAAARARPEDPEVWQLRGRYAVDQGDCAGALSYYERAVTLAPESPTSHAGLGLARLCLGDRAGASESLARAGTGPGQAHLLLAHSALRRADLSRAEHEARQVRGDLTIELASAIILAQVELRRSRPTEALAVLSRAEARRRSARASPVESLELIRGEALARLGRTTEAETALREEIRRFPGSTTAYAQLTLVLARAGRPRDEVRQLLEAMYAARPGRETALLAARVADSAGDDEAAEMWRRRASTPGSALEAALSSDPG